MADKPFYVAGNRRKRHLQLDSTILPVPCASHPVSICYLVYRSFYSCSSRTLFSIISIAHVLMMTKSSDISRLIDSERSHSYSDLYRTSRTFRTICASRRVKMHINLSRFLTTFLIDWRFSLRTSFYLKLFESPRVYRRQKLMRGLCHGETEQVFRGS